MMHLLLDFCCCSIPIQIGCVVMAVLEFFIFVLEAFTYDLHGCVYTEGEQAMVIVRLFGIFVCSHLLIMGTLRLGKQTAILLHSFGLLLLLAIELGLHFDYFEFKCLQTLPKWAIIYYCCCYLIFINGIVVGFLYFWKLNYASDEDNPTMRLEHREMSTLFSHGYYGF